MTPDEQATGGAAGDARLAESMRALNDLGAGPAPMPSERLAAFLAAPTGAVAVGRGWLLKEKLARMTSAGKVLVIGGSIALAGAASATAAWQATTPPPVPVVVPLGTVPTDAQPESGDDDDAENPAAETDSADAEDQAGTDDDAGAPSSTDSDDSEDGDDNSGKSDDSDDGDDNSGKSDDSDDGEDSGSGDDGSDDEDAEDADSGSDSDSDSDSGEEDEGSGD